jgi:hypothetical protein
MSTQQYEFRQRADGRYVIIDARTKNVIDTARGEGYRTRWGAQKAAWRMFAAKNDGTAPAPWRGPEDVVRGVHTCFETGGTAEGDASGGDCAASADGDGCGGC